MAILFELSRRFSRQLIALMALEALGALLALLGPIPLQVAVDVVVQKKPLPHWLALAFARSPVPGGNSPHLLAVLAALGVLLALLTQAQGLGAGTLSARVGEGLILALRTRLFGAALRLSLKRHLDRSASDACYRIQSDARTVEAILLDGALPMFSAVVTLAVMLTALFRLSPMLGAVGAGIAPPLILATRLIRPALRAGAREARERESLAAGVVMDSLGALSAVKAFGREDAETDRFHALAGEGVRARLRVFLLDAVLGAGVHLLSAVGTALALYVAILRVEQDRLTLGEALLGLGYIAQIYGPLKTLGRKWASLATQLAGLSRALSLLTEPSDVPEHPEARSLARARGEIALEEVAFGYDERRAVLHGVNLTIAAGEHLGVIGETGAGKTTLLSLLLRLYEPGAGAIRLDGTDLRRLKIADLRRQFAVVFQDTVLFQGTIAENIAVGRPGTTAGEIEAAARAANLHEAIAGLPDGYATRVGERGLSLSGGERQRVGLARAFLRDAPVLILDEPTSALDAATEALVLEALARLRVGRTVLTITHRAEMLAGCDRVVRVEDGALREEPAMPR